jgi:hypothetical protein
MQSADLKPIPERRNIMWFSSFMRNLKRPDMTDRRRTQRPSRQRSTFRPQLEALEDRWMPSILTVTSIADSGAGTLRADIAAAQSGDTINFAPSLDGKTITLYSGELYITKGLTIQGPGAGQLTVSGNNHSRVFEVNASQPVLLSGLTISCGNMFSAGGIGSLSGGGILNDATLTISGCIISHNGADNGGGIANLGTLTVGGCTMSHNAATNGAGILNNGALTVSGSSILYNRAAAYGGGIYNGGNRATLTVSQCDLALNSAGFEGGGIYNNVSAGPTTISQCTLYYNQSLNHGGGIYNRGRLTVSGCTLSENSAYGDGYSAGGGIYNALKITLTNCTLYSNRTSGAGGGLFVDQRSTILPTTLTNCTLSGNNSRGPGGGIFVYYPSNTGGFLYLTNTIVAGNTAGTFGADIGGPVATADHNLVGNATGSSGIVNGVNGNIVGVNPLLGPLQNNGGPTQTMALLAGSPAIGNADNALAPATDQRGVTRSDLAGELTDIGAFEL